MGMESIVTKTRTATGTTPTYALPSALARRDPAGLGVLFDLRSYTGFQVRMRWAEDGFATERILGGTAQPLAEEVDLEFLTETRVRDPRHLLARLVSPLPPDALAFVARLHSGRHHALRVLGACPAAVDLVRSSPRLLWLLLGVSRDRGTPPEQLRAVLGGRREEVLGWCGGGPTGAAVRYVERRRVGALTDWQRSRVLEECASADVIRDTLHVPEPDDHSAYLSMEHPEVLRSEVGRRSLDPATRTWSPEEIWNSWRDTLEMATVTERADVERRVMGCSTVEGLQVVHDHVLEGFLARQCPTKGRGRGRLPPPPLAGTENIEPLRYAAEVQMEGRQMRHGCGLYVDSIREGRCYLYRVHMPERATVEIDLTRSEPRIAQIKLARNEAPSPETRRAIETWLALRLEEAREKKERAETRRARRAASAPEVLFAAE